MLTPLQHLILPSHLSGSVLPYTRFFSCLLDYDYVWHLVNFAILYYIKCCLRCFIQLLSCSWPSDFDCGLFRLPDLKIGLTADVTLGRKCLHLLGTWSHFWTGVSRDPCLLNPWICISYIGFMTLIVCCINHIALLTSGKRGGGFCGPSSTEICVSRFTDYFCIHVIWR
jgi:hypothetical protein